MDELREHKFYWCSFHFEVAKQAAANDVSIGIGAPLAIQISASNSMIEEINFSVRHAPVNHVLVLRFRSCIMLQRPLLRTSESRDHQQSYDLSAVLDLKFP
jgi:hypothetical protein